MAALGPPPSRQSYATPAYIPYHGHVRRYATAPTSSHPLTRPVNTTDYGVFLGNLSDGVTEHLILAEAQKVPGGAASARIIVDKDTGQSKGYGFVNFLDANGMEAGLKHFNGLLMMGSTLSARRGNKSRSGTDSSSSSRCPVGSVDIYIGSIPLLSEDELRTSIDRLCGFQCISLCKKAGFAFATYRSVAESEQALRALNGQIVAGTRLTCQPAKKKCDKSRMQKLFDLITEGLGHTCPLSTQQLFMLEKSCRTVWLGSLPTMLTESVLTDAFREYGELVDVSIVRDSSGSRAGYGFVEYRKPEYAALALSRMKYKTSLNGQRVDIQPAKAPRDIVGTSGNSGITDSEGAPTEFLLGIFRMIHEDAPKPADFQYFQDPTTGQMYACTKEQAAEYLAQQAKLYAPPAPPPQTYPLPGQTVKPPQAYQPVIAYQRQYVVAGQPEYKQAYPPSYVSAPQVHALPGSVLLQPSPSPHLATYGKHQIPQSYPTMGVKYSPY